MEMEWFPEQTIYASGLSRARAASFRVVQPGEPIYMVDFCGASKRY
jgi:hypothetical protein